VVHSRSGSLWWRMVLSTFRLRSIFLAQLKPFGPLPGLGSLVFNGSLKTLGALKKHGSLTLFGALWIFGCAQFVRFSRVPRLALLHGPLRTNGSSLVGFPF
jgi:hypothetical protein